MAKKQIANVANKNTSTAMPKFVTKGNRVIPVYPGFEVIPGSQSEGSLLMIRDPQTGSTYRYIERKNALEVVNKALALLEHSKKTSQEDLASAITSTEKLKQDILAARAVYQKICHNTGISGTTFRFVF